MKNIYRKLAAAVLFVFGAAACTEKNIVSGDFNVIPLPREITANGEAAPFVIKPSTQVCYPKENETMERNARFLASYIKEATGTEVKVKAGTKGRNRIAIEIDGSIPQPEGYEINVDATGVTLKGSTEAAVFYGIQTIFKALPLTCGEAMASLPAGTVRDYPRLGYRGFLVDVGRHFFSVEYLKEIIDMLALHNINYFHWHLTEDQGWRIEIKKYPELTETGSYRKETITAPGSPEYDGTPVSGYYTQEDAKEIVRYAAERFITVIPEIDLPGHTQAALASYPELGCTGGPYEVATRFGVFREVLCGGNPQALQFAKDVLEEIMDIFPSEYIHIGGDECPKERWEECPECQAKIRELGLTSTPGHTKENQLQTYFMGEVEKVITARGRKMIGWDEILEGLPTETSIIMAWTSVNAGIKSARQNHKTIVAPIAYYYFSNPGFNKLRGRESIGRVYNFEPVADVLTAQEKQNIIGTQGCIWTEWTKDREKMEWQMMPRIAALCETQWTAPEKKNLDAFLQRLLHQLDIYRLRGYNYKEDIEEAYQAQTEK